jgi:hypothetical protein
MRAKNGVVQTSLVPMTSSAPVVSFTEKILMLSEP